MGDPLSGQTVKCPACGAPLGYAQATGQWACQFCGFSQPPGPAQGPGGQPLPQAPQGWGQPAVAAQAPPPASPWFQNSYRIRKKVLALTHQYWIEGQGGALIGYGKQEPFRLKEDIRVYTDEGMQREIFRIKQEGIVDAWGTFAVIDSATGAPLGYIRRRALASMVRAEWEVLDAARQLVGGLHEATGRGVARRMIPGGRAIPERMTLELGGRPVAQINQEFKVIGDVWDIAAQDIPPAFDRRVLVACALLMGMVEEELERR